MRARSLLWIAGGLLVGRLISQIFAPTVIRPRRGVPLPEPLPARGRFSHDDFDVMLERYVNHEGLVNYAALKESRELLDRYLVFLGAYSPRSHPDLFPSDPDKLAYWINAYNAFAIAGVLAYYPVESVAGIRPAFAFFRAIKFIAGNRELSLDDIEHRIIRQAFGEPRIHFAINCASMGCPRLPPHAFHPNRLDTELDEAARSFVAEDRNVRVDTEGKTVALSMIFNWYEGDFLGWLKREMGMESPGILDYAALYTSGEKRKALIQPGLRIEYIPYDWTLNDQRIGRR